MPNHSTLVFDTKEKLIEIIDGVDEQTFFYNGILCPGFINAHCHLELSHLKNRIEKGTGLLNFILEVVTKRHLFKNEYYAKNVEEEIAYLEKQGVVAVGDICNTIDTLLIKKKSTINFHNFIEIIGFDEKINPQKCNTFELVLETFKKNSPKAQALFATFSLFCFCCNV